MEVYAERKQKWEEYVEDHEEVASLSHLIRSSVEDHIGGISTDGGGGNTFGDEATAVLDEIVQGVNRMEETIEDVDGRLNSVESELRRSSDLSELTDQVYRLLPTVEPGSESWEAAEFIEGERTVHPEAGALPSLDDVGEDNRVTTSGRPDEIAHTLGEDEVWVRAGLEQLCDDVVHVHRTSVDGGTYYWREE